MRKCGIRLLLALAIAVAALPGGVVGVAAQTLPLVNVSTTQAVAAELTALQEKENKELKALQDKAAELQKKLITEILAVNAQMMTVREKYKPRKYALMDKVNPGSGTALAKRDSEETAVREKFASEMERINKAERITTDGKELNKLAAERRAVMATQRESMQKLFPASKAGR